MFLSALTLSHCAATSQENVYWNGNLLPYELGLPLQIEDISVISVPIYATIISSDVSPVQPDRICICKPSSKASKSSATCKKM